MLVPQLRAGSLTASAAKDTREKVRHVNCMRCNDDAPALRPVDSDALQKDQRAEQDRFHWTLQSSLQHLEFHKQLGLMARNVGPFSHS